MSELQFVQDIVGNGRIVPQLGQAFVVAEADFGDCCAE